MRFSFIVLSLLFLVTELALLAPSAVSAERKLSIALFVDRGASIPARKNFKRLLNSSDNITFDSVDGNDIYNGALTKYEVLIVPGGSAMKDAFSMGTEAREEVKRFVRNGGIYMGVCAGAYLSSTEREKYLGLLPIKTRDQEHWFRTADGTMVDVELTPQGQEVFGTPNRNLQILYENGPIFGLPEEKTEQTLTPLGYFRSEVVAKGGEKGVMLGAPAAILSRYGKGIVLAVSPHPEKTPHEGHILLHALFWLRDHRDTP